MCFGTDEDDAQDDWTSPCRCCGATKWVHQGCLQAWIDQKQKGSSSADVACPQCKFSYQIRYPGTSRLLLTVYEFGNKVVSTLSPMILAGITASALYWVSFSYGIATVIVAMGRDEAVEVVRSSSSSYIIPLVPLIPWGLFGLKMLRPEVKLLRLWYGVVCPTLQKIIIKGSIPVQQNSFSYTPTHVAPVPFISRCVMSALFLPPISALLGETVFSFLKTTKTRRTLLGLSAYLIVGISVKLYLENHRARQYAPRGANGGAEAVAD